MNGWTFAGWAVAAIVVYAVVWQASRHKDEMARVNDENAVLWDQIQRFNDSWAESRARQAVTN